MWVVLVNKVGAEVLKIVDQTRRNRKEQTRNKIVTELAKRVYLNETDANVQLKVFAWRNTIVKVNY